MKMTKAEYLAKYKGIRNYKGTDRYLEVEAPDDVIPHKNPALKEQPEISSQEMDAMPQTDEKKKVKK